MSQWLTFRLAFISDKALQYNAGNMMVFLETENNEKIIDFYTYQNGFKLFDLRENKSKDGKDRLLVQY